MKLSLVLYAIINLVRKTGGEKCYSHLGLEMLFSFNRLIPLFHCLEAKSSIILEKILQIDFHAHQVHFQPFHQHRLIHNFIVHLLLCCSSQSDILLQNKVISVPFFLLYSGLILLQVMQLVPVHLYNLLTPCCFPFLLPVPGTLLDFPSYHRYEIALLFVSQLYSNVLYIIMQYQGTALLWFVFIVLTEFIAGLLNCTHRDVIENSLTSFIFVQLKLKSDLKKYLVGVIFSIRSDNLNIDILDGTNMFLCSSTVRIFF